MTCLRSSAFLTLWAVPALALPATVAAQPQPDPEPTTAPSSEGMDDEAEPILKKKSVEYGAGFRLDYVFLPSGVIEMFVERATSLSAFGFGAELVRRRGNFDLVFGFRYANVSPEDGYYTEKGRNPGEAGSTDLVTFEGLSLLGLDTTFLWHARLGERVWLRYGAGIGLGVVMGDVYQTDVLCPAGTTVDQLDEGTQCMPVGAAQASDDVPPVVPLVNALIGARIQAAQNLFFNVETGFRDVFFLGTGVNYMF